ncbi:DUF1428 domain-containing protein [Mangrovicoccus ximenensis]|uniref:DUF1428 domain-containing protein n=1 Tax=Mangrovicoccus ximenensis TaxID=1911570 RepID=UPI000D3902D9|nr:DUF1428 domain-containing protein [Mangrovicoccus ximenensis]
MTYVTGMAVPVPAAKKAEYIAGSERSWPLFQRAGALEMKECWGTDVPEGVLTSFPMAVKKEPDEVVVLSWILWPGKAEAEACFAAMESDPAWAEVFAAGMPFDGKRMIHGGFEVVVSR